MLQACASEHDRFYTLSTVPPSGRTVLATPSRDAILTVTVPALVDRAEMVISTSNNGIMVLDHERWAVALADQVTQTLARDLEARRNDLLVSDRVFASGNSPPIKIKVEFVHMSAQRDAEVRIEARWHVVDAADQADQIGSEQFDIPASGGGYAAVAQAYSTALGKLADAIIAHL